MVLTTAAGPWVNIKHDHRPRTVRIYEQDQVNTSGGVPLGQGIKVKYRVESYEFTISEIEREYFQEVWDAVKGGCLPLTHWPFVGDPRTVYFHGDWYSLRSKSGNCFSISFQLREEI